MPVETSAKIGEILVESRLITKEQLKAAQERQRMTGRLLGEILIELGFATEENIAQALSKQFGFAFVNVDTYRVDPKALEKIPQDFCRKNNVLPLFEVDGILTVAMENPLNVLLVDRLKRLCRCEVDPLFATASAVKRAVERHYGSRDSLTELLKGFQTERPTGPVTREAVEVERTGAKTPVEKVDVAIAEAEKAPVIRIVDTVIKQAADLQASDIHIEPEEEKCFLRYRIDGILHDFPAPPKEMEAAVISRVKIMANMDIAERRLPQDGRINFVTDEGRVVDLRVSTFPTIYGENVVLRVLDRSQKIFKLEQLGFEPKLLTNFRKAIRNPNGVVLVTGPTGCGKTTTLYAVLNEINSPKHNIITLEDPVEYRIQRIRQCQVDPKAGLTFASGLRNILRQDPDIIMIGEIRDPDTVEIAIRSALTGHLVLSTLHTNDAPSAVTRLVDMGVEPFLVSSSVVGVLAQRLVRTLCTKCKEKYTPPAEILHSLGLGDGERGLNAKKGSDPFCFYREKGCEHCKTTGFKGRMAIFEFMRMTEKVRELVLKECSAVRIREQALEEGMVTLKASGIHRILEGVTSVSEVLRVVEEETA